MKAQTDQQSRAVAKPASLAAWWQIFHDPVLDDLVERALAANLDLKIAEARVRQSRASRAATAAGLWPGIDATGSYRRTRTGNTSSERSGSSTDTSSSTAYAPGASPESADPSAGGTSGVESTASSKHAIRQNLYQAGLDAAWELDIFGGTSRDVEAADADTRAAIEDLHDVMVSLIGELGATYISLRGYQQQLAIAKKNLAAQRHTVNITRKRFEAGFVSGLDVANAQAQAAATESQVPLLESTARRPYTASAYF